MIEEVEGRTRGPPDCIAKASKSFTFLYFLKKINKTSYGNKVDRNELLLQCDSCQCLIEKLSSNIIKGKRSFKGTIYDL